MSSENEGCQLAANSGWARASTHWLRPVPTADIAESAALAHAGKRTDNAITSSWAKGMHLPAKLKTEHHRFERFNIVFPILLAGWVPSILTLVVSYTILTNTLESKILRDRQTFVQLIGHLVGDDLSRTGGIIEYYQTLPDVAKIPTSPNAPSAAQQWLSATFYSHPRIDGMFIADSSGHLIGAIPSTPTLIGRDFGSELWRDPASATRA